MKPFYFLLIATGFSIFSFAQTEGTSKLYGYQQPVIPGTIRADENGNPVKGKQHYNYYMYLTSADRVTPVEIWIGGQAYAVTANPVSAPVEYTNPTSGDDKPQVLVPKTNKHVLQLGTSLNPLQKPVLKGKTLSLKNELVVVYKSKGKLYYKTIAKLKPLEPLAMQ